MRQALLNTLTCLTVAASAAVASIAALLAFGVFPSFLLDLRPASQAGPTLLAESTRRPSDTPSPPTLTSTVTPTATITLTPTVTTTPSETLSPTPAPSLVLGPYLQMPHAGGMTLVWETDRPSPGEVAYGETEAYGAQAVDPAAPQRRHAIEIPGLVPGLTYHYQIRADGLPLTSDLTFHPPPSLRAGPLRVAVFGDTRTGHSTHRAVIGRVVAWEPDIALHTGDLVSHGSSFSEWLTFFDIEDPLLRRTALLPTLGNHEDVSEQYFDLFYLPPNERWFRLEIGPALFISLELDGRASFEEGSEQYAWLESVLKQHTSGWVIVWGHIPPHSAVSENSEEVNIRRALGPLFEDYGVDLVLSGHHHDYQRYVLGGQTYIITGGGGAELHPVTQEEDGMQAFANEAHFVGLVIRDDTLTGDAISSAGEILDHFILHAD